MAGKDGGSTRAHATEEFPALFMRSRSTMPILHQASPTYRIPPEIWLEIFIEACTDTGLTGRSLASVSHFISSASQLAKHQSIALHGLHQILAFASILTKIPAHLRTVRYLFITKTPLPSSPNMHIESDDISDSSAEMSGAFWAILAAIASTIEVLHLDFVAYKHHPMPFPSFPRLRDLQSDSRFFELDMMDIITESERANGSNGTRPCALLPVLCYWNITTVPPMHFRTTFLTCLPALTPSLSHIRVLASCFKPWGIMGDYVRSSESVAPLQSSIQKLYVTINARHAMQIYLIRILTDLNTRGDPRFVLLQPDLVYPDPHAVGEWLERVGGGEGCWSLRGKVFPGEEPWSLDAGM
ncbi:hypothetical protein FIBSPDRAFT_868349 [Athelia psychrophila]|uniref:F-box domain-containing protein n=1 Tax=Athelia psychrophila TaxID=1759441 RepID=A0A166D6Z6_9AGAM|nr:hypothetical protein FIBSPDRAFT_868349 [Fibularhizoctonia sp. CBS 109695]